jgi:hypothetical protein
LTPARSTDDFLEEAVVALDETAQQLLGEGGPDLPVSGSPASRSAI